MASPSAAPKTSVLQATSNTKSPAPSETGPPTFTSPSPSQRLPSGKVGIEKSSKVVAVDLSMQAKSPPPPQASKKAQRKDKNQKHKNHHDDEHHGLHLYEDDLKHHKSMAQYLRGFTMPGPQEKDAEEKPASTKLGCMLGVYLPTVQNIMGVTMFLRLLWIIGVGGIGFSFIMVFLCCLCTFLTSISVSAVATNGVLESGGTYYMISRNLGPEFGTSIGILFYLGNTVATSMYCIGGVELLLVYMFPKMPQFGDPKSHDIALMLHNFRLYGSALLVVVMIIVAMGVNVVQMTAPLSLGCVILSVIAVYIGGFSARPDDGPWLCMVGEKVLLPHAYDGNITQCNREYLLDKVYKNMTEENLKKFINADIRVVDGIPGPSNGQLFLDNFGDKYLEQGEAAPGQPAAYSEENGHKHYYEVYQDVASSFFIIWGIFFPSVTGIFTGCNMSGDLKDAQRSLPMGTIAAQLTTSFVYLSYVFLFGGTIRRELLRDKYGDALNKSMIVAQIAWPNQWVLLVGAFLSTFGAALQSLCSAPRLLQSIARDDVIPKLRIFGNVNRWNEPWNALWLTSFIAWLAILVGSIEGIAPVVDFFFLMCYLSVNAICVLQEILKSPNWRPRYKYYHWTFSLLGALLCFSIMILTYWYYTLAVIFLALVIFKYVEFKGARKEWGDGIRGLALSTAQFSLQRLEDTKHLHPKNWRPQLLVLVKVSRGDEQTISRKLIQLAAQLKGGQGLTILATLIEGDINDKQVRENGELVDVNLKTWLKEAKIRGFTKVIIGRHTGESISCIIQSIGIGGLRPNTVIVGWPKNWRKTQSLGEYMGFTDAIHRAATVDMCLLIPKGILNFPAPTDTLTGTIDVWWIIHAGGLVILLPFLMKMDPLWSRCKLRVFAVAQPNDNTVKMKQDLQAWVYQLRIDASVDVIELAEQTISAYVYERSIRERLSWAHEQGLDKELQKQPQMVVDKYRHKQSVNPDYALMPDLPHHRDKESKVNKTLSDVGDRSFRKWTSAVRLNRVIKTHSSGSQLTVINLPRPPASQEGLVHFLEYIEVLTDGLKRVILVRGSGREVITIY